MCSKKYVVLETERLQKQIAEIVNTGSARLSVLAFCVPILRGSFTNAEKDDKELLKIAQGDLRDLALLFHVLLQRY